MKVQRQGQKLRLRVSREEFDDVLKGKAVVTETAWPDGRKERIEVLGADHSAWLRLADGWQVCLQASALRDLAARLPQRDGCVFEQPVPGGDPLVVAFDVDLHRERG